MNKKEMIDYIVDNVKGYLPDEYQDAAVEIVQVNKLNCSYTGLSIRKPDENMVPTINLDRALLNTVTFSVEDAKSIMREIGNQICDDNMPAFDVRDIIDYDRAKEKLFMKLVDKVTNAEALKYIPHVDVQDMALTFHIMLDAEGCNTTSATVRNEMLDVWGITGEELHHVALANTERLMPARICTLAEALGFLGFSEPVEDNPLVLVSNENGQFGASVIFYPGVQERIREFVGGSYYVLPSSVHEILVISEAKNNATVKELLAMVTEINATQVAPDEKLTDSVYFYDAEKKEFSKVS